MKKHEEELLNILESNIDNKAHYVNSLASLYPDDHKEIMEAYDTWNELATINVVPPSKNMDDNFYKQLAELEQEKNESAKVVPLKKESNNVFSLRRLGVAMTFLLGLALGGYLDLFNTSSSPSVADNNSQHENYVTFASLEQTPNAGDRIKGIINAKKETNPNQKILEALNDVLCNDPNVNVRLSAIETLVLFWDIPEAREILIKAIPRQDSPIVQMELADVMISLEAKSSSNKWNQLLTSGTIEPDIKDQLQNTLKELL